MAETVVNAPHIQLSRHRYRRGLLCLVCLHLRLPHLNAFISPFYPHHSSYSSSLPTFQPCLLVDALYKPSPVRRLTQASPHSLCTFTTRRVRRLSSASVEQSSTRSLVFTDPYLANPLTLPLVDRK